MKNDKNIVIIGMPGSGKTTFGKALANRLGWEFIDADDFVVALEGKTIPDMFAISEDYFRDAETRAAEALAAKRGLHVHAGFLLPRCTGWPTLQASALSWGVNTSPPPA